MKTYIKPEIKRCMLASECVLAASEDPSDQRFTTNPSNNPATHASKDNTFDVWDKEIGE